MPFIVVVLIFIGLITFKNMMNRAAQDERARRGVQNNVPVQPSAGQQTTPSAQQRAQTSGKPAVYKSTPSTLAEQRRQEIMRQAQQMKEQAKILRDAIEGRAPAQQTRPAVQTRPVQPARPVVAHSDDDCGGGSIHDGYHEGVSGDPFGEHKGTAVAGNLGKRLGEESERARAAQLKASNAQRVIESISKLPPLTQGIVFSEILGKPKSELS